MSETSRTVTDEQLPRLDKWLVDNFGKSRRFWQKEIADSRVNVNGKAGSKGMLLKPGDLVEIQRDGGVPAGTIPGKPSQPVYNFPILYSDQWIIAISKPAGMACHPLGEVTDGQRGQTVTEQFALQEPAVRFEPDSGATKSERRRILLQGGLLNRLDNDSSGILLFAKSMQAWRLFSDLVHGRIEGIRKSYAVRVHYEAGIHLPASIDAAIAHHVNRNSPRMIAVDSSTRPAAYRGKARSAHTEIVQLFDLQDDTALVFARLHRGQRHQLRCHLAQLQTPAVGDSLYGGRPLSDEPMNGFFLHQFMIELTHPVTSRQISIYDEPMRFAENIRQFAGDFLGNGSVLGDSDPDV